MSPAPGPVCWHFPGPRPCHPLAGSDLFLQASRPYHFWLCEPPLPSEEPWVILDASPPTLSCTFRGILGLSSLFLLGSLVPGHWQDLLRFLEKA